MNAQQAEQLRALPPVSELLDTDRARLWSKTTARADIVDALRAALEQTRECILTNSRPQAPVDREDILRLAEDWLVRQTTPSLRPVINATGVVLHTGLGRAPLSRKAIDAIVKGASGYCNLEYDLTAGTRGRRQSHVSDLLCKLTGAEAATVVNNNAAALVLAMRALCENREVIVSRGQLVEIGGSFRMPEVMAAGGAVLREVGTTNRTRISDYRDAVTEDTAALLHVHHSNFRIVGFTEQPDAEALTRCAHDHDLIAIDDLGSGAMFDFSHMNLPLEPDVHQSITAGFDLICFSADKLLGGPQAGIILGRKDLITRIEAHPLMRSYRVDKLALLALEATLRLYSDRSAAIEHIPTLAMLNAAPDQLAERARKLAHMLSAALPNEEFSVGTDTSYAGGGSLPGEGLETVVINWRPSQAHGLQSVGSSLNAVVAQLRQAHGLESVGFVSASTPVIARIKNDHIIFDLRTLRDSDFQTLVTTVCGTIPRNVRMANGE
ncbi:MAG: L-seryl-tRNA(Sec) selenium transferase [Phycisphaerae bacterium]